MKVINAPKKHAETFGVNGQRTSTGIPVTVAPTTGFFSLDKGISDLNMIPRENGGIPPGGKDMNQILFELSATKRWFDAGGPILFDADYVKNINGYPKGTILTGNDYLTLWRSTVDDNATDPNNGGAGWQKVSDYINGLLNLGTAAFRNVGKTEGSGQIPDMTAYTYTQVSPVPGSGTEPISIFKLPGGLTILIGLFVVAQSQTKLTFPITFADTNFIFLPVVQSTNGSGIVTYVADSKTVSSINIVSNSQDTGFNWVAIGKTA